MSEIYIFFIRAWYKQGQLIRILFAKSLHSFLVRFATWYKRECNFLLTNFVKIKQGCLSCLLQFMSDAWRFSKPDRTKLKWAKKRKMMKRAPAFFAWLLILSSFSLISFYLLSRLILLRLQIILAVGYISVK